MPQENKHNDQVLVQAILSNDEGVIKGIYLENFKKIEHYILRNSGNEEQAKDLYQEAFLAFWMNIRNGKFKPEGKKAVSGYLYQIAKNKWLDYLRSAQRKKTVLVDEFSAIEKSTILEDESHWKIEPKKRLALDAFQALGEKCKTLLTKFYFEKKSMRKISEELGIEAASARNQKYRCMEKLRSISLLSQESK